MEVTSYLDNQFGINDLVTLKYFLAIEAACSTDGLVLNQRKYTLDILKDSKKIGVRPISFPIEQNHNLTYSTTSGLVDGRRYLYLVGRLIYLTVTQPDIAYVVSILS